MFMHPGFTGWSCFHVKLRILFESQLSDMSDSNPSFNSKQISHLRALAHALKPVVMIGNNGLTEKVLHEIETALNAHELIKIKVQGDDRALRTQMLQDICAKSGATAIHHIGKQLVVYRAATSPKILFPK